MFVFCQIFEDLLSLKKMVVFITLGIFFSYLYNGKHNNVLNLELVYKTKV